MRKTLYRTTANQSIKKGFVETKHGQIYYWTAGQGEPILLIHQSSSSSEEYAGMVPYLADKYQVISYDWSGHGNSDDPNQELGVEEYTDNALAVLRHLNIENCHVLGHHGGALLAMNLAYLFPDQIQKVMLSGTSGLKEKEESEKFKKNLPSARKDILGKDGDSILAAWKRYVNYLPDAEPNEILRPFLNSIMTRIRPYDAHHGVLNWDRTLALNSLKDKSVLLLQGSLDAFVSKQETLLEILPKAERVVIERGGPFNFYDKCEESSAAIRKFLEKKI